MTTFTVCGPVRGKARPRFDRKTGHAYTPDATREYEAMIQAAYFLAHGAKAEGPVSVSMTAYQALPKRATKAMREAAERGAIWPIRKPDLDNVIKIVLDALNGCAYTDDTQVVQLEARKEYAADGESRLVVSVGEANDHGVL